MTNAIFRVPDPTNETVKNYTPKSEEAKKLILAYRKIYAEKIDIPLLIDAEESWIQKAADELVENMMALYNKEQAIVFCTLQIYRTDRLDYLKPLYQKAIEEGFTIGVKLERGAYLENERLRAAEMA